MLNEPFADLVIEAEKLEVEVEGAEVFVIAKQAKEAALELVVEVKESVQYVFDFVVAVLAKLSVDYLLGDLNAERIFSLLDEVLSKDLEVCVQLE